MKKTGMVSIDIREFFGSLLEQWRLIVIVLAVTAVVIPCIMSVQDNRDAKNEADTYRELALLSDEEKLGRLSETERNDVVYALSLKNFIEQREKDIAASGTLASDSDDVDSQIAEENNFMEMKDNFRALVLSFKDEQTLIYNSITSEDDSYISYSDPGITFSVKRVALGFAVGVVLYVFCYLAYLVFSSRIRSSAVITDTLGTGLLGTVSKYSFNGFAAFAHSRFVYRVLRKTSIDGRSDGTVTDAAVSVCKHGDYGKVLLVDPGFGKEFSGSVQELAGKISKASGADVSCSENLSGDKALDNVDAVILCVRSGSTEYSEITNIAKLCDHCGKKIAGGIYFD